MDNSDQWATVRPMGNPETNGNTFGQKLVCCSVVSPTVLSETCCISIGNSSEFSRGEPDKIVDWLSLATANSATKLTVSCESIAEASRSASSDASSFQSSSISCVGWISILTGLNPGTFIWIFCIFFCYLDFVDKPVYVVHKMLDTNLLKMSFFELLEYHRNIPFLEVFLRVCLFDFCEMLLNFCMSFSQRNSISNMFNISIARVRIPLMLSKWLP